MSLLKIGSVGQDVATLQKNLNKVGFSLSVDGYFGSHTLAAVEAFQAAHKLSVDGIVGPNTQAALLYAINNLPIPPTQFCKGIDIYAGNSVSSFAAAKAAGWDFCIHKATEGDNHIDSAFKSRWAKIKDAGMIPGAYLFFRPGVNPKDQFNLFDGVVSPLLSDTDLPWALDYGEFDLSPTNQLRDYALTILELMEKASGKIPMVYGATGLLSQYQLTTDFARYASWLANFSHSEPPIVFPWASWNFFQYAESGSVPGMGAGTDVNKFNGTLAQLKNFISASIVP